LTAANSLFSSTAPTNSTSLALLIVN